MKDINQEEKPKHKEDETHEVSRKDPAKNKPTTDKPEKNRDDGEIVDLCATCVKRDTCTLPKPEGGVWHCEEYNEE